jgi:DNA repair photolyase
MAIRATDERRFEGSEEGEEIKMGMIYAPAGRAGEYAKIAFNIYTTCAHKCEYCWCPAVTHKPKEVFFAAKPRMNEQLWKAFAKELPSFRDSPDQVLLSFLCDPYQPIDVELQHTRRAIKMLHEFNIPVCVLTKGGSRALRDIDLFTPEDTFATTLTFNDAAMSSEFEPGAALPADRLNTLLEFHNAGIPTWVSCEPVIDTIETLTLIEAAAPFVSLFKVGMWNYDVRAKYINWAEFGHDAESLLQSLGKPYLIKDDLRAMMEER